MNSFELNKILGAILATCLITLALNIGASAIFSSEKPAKPGYAIAVKEHDEGDKAGAAEQYGTVEVVAKLAAANGVFDRQLAIFWADHGIRTADAVRIARTELTTRADLSGHHALA